MSEEERERKIWEIVRWLISQGYTPDDEVEVRSLFNSILSRSEAGELIETVEL